ncbi:MAG: hypothetical protein ACFHVJ_14135 [Aestuariibacter sp.]
MERLFKVLAGIWLVLTTAAYASDVEQEVISKVIKAYGGESLTSMKSLIVRDRYKTITRDGGVRPGLDAVSRLHSTLIIDYVHGRKSVKNWRVDATGKRLGQIMFDGTSGWSINYLRGSHVMREDLTHKRVGAGMMRLLDTTLVRLLTDAVDTANYEGQTTLLGRVHDKLSFKINGSVDVTLYIDNTTGLITQMERTNGVHYVYSEHRIKDGITYASDTNQFRHGRPATITLSREIEVNPDVSKAFILPKDTKPLEGMRDVSKMQVKTIGEDVYLVGKGVRSSIFVDTGDYFIAAGSLSGFEARMKAVNEKIGAEKSVRYFVVPEHHPGHMGDIKKIATMGVQFVTVDSHLLSLKKRIGNELSDDRFILVDGVLDLADGKVQLHDISTITSEHFLLFYIPGTKLVYTMDEFGANLLNSVPSADKRMLSFRDAIEAIDIDVQQFAHVHGTGVLTLEQFRQVTDAYQEGFCPDGHTICAEY